ncbi:MAG: T9SS type A sorting domain-containing protein [Bacteroidales bacterium]|nr:T9SS type A sorting domain-containing protein [Bacteroidales bacterium]
MKISKHFTFLLFLIIGFSANGQQYYDFGFTRDNAIEVNDSLGNLIGMPWVGGLNAVHFQEFDLNFDSNMDLVVFDVQGNRLLTFLNNGSSTSFPYSYAPEYEVDFPEIMSWMQTLDFDNDGDLDLFFYSTYGAGITYYKNVSSSGKIKFELVTNTINYSIPGWPSTNIFVSSVDYPAMVDVDNDGDVDILTFSVLGTFIYYYKNHSMENHGVPDSLDYKLQDHCWGKFHENDSTNEVILNDPCIVKAIPKTSGNALKHTGSTLLAIDLNNDTLKDLILGDVDYFTLNGLINGGTLDSAHMISQDITFPSNTQSVDVITFPLAKYIDINNDSKKDLIVSPFESVYYKPENRNSVWIYENTGSNSLPIFNFVKKDFFQDQMFDVGDGANPSLVDVDGDGLLDIVISNYGFVDSTYLDSVWYILYSIKISQLTYYRNVGTSGNPKYQYMDEDWAGLSSLKKIALRATFGDIDDDGDADMLVGSDDGNIIYYENIAGSGQTISFAPPVMNYQSLSVGDNNYSSPQLIDIDNDNLLDLIVGKKTYRLRKINYTDSIVGYISYYRNTGTATQPVFTLETDTMGNINIQSYYSYYSSYSSPYFFRDSNDSLKLFVGSASGLTFYYRDIENNIHGTFGVDSNLVYNDIVQTLYSVFSYDNHDNNLVSFDAGLRSAPLVHDFNNDGYPDMMLGGFAGGLVYFKGKKAPGVGFENAKNISTPDMKLYPNPAEDYVNLSIDKYKDLQLLNIEIRDMTGRLISTKQTMASKNTRLNTSHLKQGIYFVRVDSKSYSGQEFSHTMKLMIL